jgi:hypothetical protein
MKNFPFNIGLQMNSERALTLEKQRKSKYLQHMFMLSCGCTIISPLLRQTSKTKPSFQETRTAPP